MCEFSIHGSPVLISALLECLCALDARLAEPGEFTMRAFLHGRIDLTQAEAVRDIIDATTLYQAQVAARQRAGSLAQQIRPIKELLIDIIVNLESAVEFAEQDLPVASRESIGGKLESVRAQLRNWIDSFQRGRIVRDGFSMAIVGRPNVGKSSLFNALLVQNRSIVTEMPGTTRDLVSEFTNIGGIPVRLQDTAGIHDSGSFVEKLGIDRSMQAIADADAILLVVDTSRPLAPQDLMMKQQLQNLRCFVAMNKSDLVPLWSAEEKHAFAGEWPFVEVSAKTASGIEELRTGVLGQILGPAGTRQDGMLVTNLRHCRNLETAEKDMAHASAALQEGLSEEFALIDLREGLQKLGEITGETGVEDILAEIFSHFCIGK
jgi:tRNA modification GTPase